MFYISEYICESQFGTKSHVHIFQKVRFVCADRTTYFLNLYIYSLTFLIVSGNIVSDSLLEMVILKFLSNKLTLIDFSGSSQC